MSIAVKALALGLGLSTFIVLSAPVDAATVTASSCAPAAVQSAVNAASTGDTVAVPAGACSWGGTTVVLPSSKAITLKGAGIDVTTINSAGGSMAIRIGEVGVGGRSRVTGFTFAGGHLVVDGDGWRVDHVKLVSATSGVLGEGVFAWGLRPGVPYGPTGLVDNVTFVDTRVLVYGFPDVPAKSAASSVSPLGLGDVNAVYVENSTFTFHGQPNVIDCNYAGRFVFRHNTVINSSIDAHSVQGWNRACRRWEVYHNTVRLVNSAYFTPVFIRGGTGVIFNNTFTGSWGEPFISFDNVRSFESRSDWFPIGPAAPGSCNGASPWDGNQSSNGWPCRDQIGRGGDNAAWTATAPYPAQNASPTYIWNNTMNGNPATVQIRNDSGAWIQAGRDYVLNAGPKPGYTPYPYPHPLTGDTSAPPPAPTGLTVR